MPSPCSLGHPYDISAQSGAPGAAASPALTWQMDGSIGPYRLIERIGSGGMGEVWLAEQTQPVRRRVALKLIKAGMDTGEVMTRFQSERQALALMGHPNIAKVFDAGSTPQGRPYFAMEYIAGVPITTYCDQDKMPIRERLELFIQACDGVQHAHQKAIIHRDLKPSNILVGEVDGKPVPRIIDFGIAKATARGVMGNATFTQAGVVVGTPAYMSPEQAGSSGADVDTRTDVYSLGVVLYELLVGERPFDFHDLPFGELLRRLREAEPPRPSAKFRHLGGDLDAIVLKALEKDRACRYDSPADLAADIGRYLRNEAVEAVPPSAVYRARKFARRYRVALATTVAFMLVLITAAAVSIRQSVLAMRQRDRADRETAVAQAVNDFLQNDLLAQASAANQAPGNKPNPHMEVRTALDRAAARIGGKFGNQPEVEAAIRVTIGQTYRDLGLLPEARAQLERALKLYRQSLGADDPKTLKAMSQFGHLLHLQGDLAQAEKLLSQTIEVSRRSLGPEHRDTVAAMSDLASVDVEQGKILPAEALYARVLEIRQRVLGAERPDTLAAMDGLAYSYGEEHQQAKYAQAEALHKQALEIRRRVLGAEHPDTLISMHNLGVVYDYDGKYAQAEALLRQTLDTQRRVLGPRHPETLRSANMLANALSHEQKYKQAEALFSRVLEIRHRLLGAEHPDTLLSMGHLAMCYAVQQRYVKAEALYKEALETSRRALGSNSPETYVALWGMFYICQRQGRYALAESYVAQGLEVSRHIWGSESEDRVADLALALLSQGKYAAAEPLAREALEAVLRKQPHTWEAFRAKTLLGASLAGQKRYFEAEPLLLEGYRGMVAEKGQTDPLDWYELDLARQWLIRLYRAWDKPEKAAAWRK